jgi:uncharacterized protein (DUF1697 family)
MATGHLAQAKSVCRLFQSPGRVPSGSIFERCRQEEARGTRGSSERGQRRRSQNLPPTTLAEQLKHLGAVNIGAAGTFVIRRPVTRAQLRAELARRLPFEAAIIICQGREIVRLMSQNHFADQPVRPGIVRFVSVLSKRPRLAQSTPMSFPSSGKWLLKILARDNRFVFGVYRRHMKVISYLGTFDRLFGVPVTTRNWNTITAIARVLGNGRT